MWLYKKVVVVVGNRSYAWTLGQYATIYGAYRDQMPVSRAATCTCTCSTSLQNTCMYTVHAINSTRILTFEIIHLQHLQCSMFPPKIKSSSQYPPRGAQVVMEPIVPVGLFGLVSGRVLTPELITFAVRNTNPTSHIIPPLDIFHYSSDIVEG